MANETFTAIQTTVATPGFDADGDGVIDPGEIVTITNNSTTPTPVAATDVQFTEDLQGMTLVNQAGDDINASPIAFDDSYTAAGNVAFTGVAMLNNDAEPLGPEGLALNAGTAIQNTGVAFATTQGGSVTLNANGTFTYISAVGFEGVDTFTYTLRDTGLDAVAGNADDLSGTGTVSITVGPSVWFIDNTAAPGGNGTQASPFNSIAAFNLAQGTANGPDAGDFIYLRQGTGTYSEANGINLATGQTLIGQGQNLVVNGVTIEVGSAGLTPTIQVTGADEGVLLAQNNTLSGFNISTTNAAADGIEDGGGTVGTLTVSNVSISGTGQAVDIDQGGTLNVTLASVTSTGASEEGIQLANVAGSFTASTVSLNGMTGDGIDLDNNSATVAINGGSIGNSNDPGGIGVDIAGGAGNVTIAASVTKTTAGDIVEVTGRTGGTVTLSGNLSATGAVSNGIDVNSNTGGTINFTGQTQTLTTGANTAVNLASNTGATINFNATSGGNGLDITTTSGVGFNATGGGTVTVQGTGNTISSGTGTALNIASTTIGASDVTFQSISANGASSGIVLNTTGALGGLTVTGDGTGVENGAGGLITNTTGVGISLTNTRDVSLTQLRISNTGGHGIDASSVTNFTYQDASIVNAGNGNDEQGINLLNIFGTSLIEDVRLDDIQEDGIQIRQNLDSDANLGTFDTITIRRLDVEDHQPGFGEAGIEIQTDLASTLAVVVDDSDFAINTNAIMGVAMSKSAAFTGHQKVTVQNSTFDASAAFGSGAIQALGSIGSGTTTYLITGNTITNTQFDGIRVNNDGGHTNVTITNNDIDGSTAVGKVNNGEGITLRQDENGSMTVLISGNDMTQITSNQIRINAGDATIDDNVINVDATITNSTGTVAGAFGAGLLVDVGDGSGIAKNDVRINVTGNNLNGTNTTPFFDFDITLNLNETSGASLRVTQASDAALAAADISTTISSFANPPNTITYNAGTPPLPPVPLLAAEGGVEAASEPDPVAAEPPVLPAADEIASGGTGAPDPALTPTPALVNAGDGVLSQAELDTFVDAAVARWSEAGLTEAQLDALEAMSFGIADMTGLNLASFAPGVITLDSDAAGLGWYLDPTPLDDAEFGNAFSATWMETDPTGAPAGSYDLLTAVMHEMGHALGLGDSYSGDHRADLMYGWLYLGERRLPGRDDTDGAVAGSIASEEFLGAPIDIGVLPAGKTVTIQWQATIDPQTNQLIVNPQNTGTVSATNGVGFPDQNTNTVTTLLDTLILGGTIWNDNGAGGGTVGNGILDGTEPGVSGVALTLFADTGTTAGVWDAADTQIATTTTAGGGNYAFTGLAPGEYTVRVDQDNFDAGGNTSLVATPISSVTSPEPPDPDNNVDNDDNGARVLGQPAFSQAITLAYNTEPTPGTGNDTNTTLDFGFSPAADLSVSKTVSNPTPNVGDQITFTVTLSNQSPGAATGVQVTDLLPAGLTFVSATPSQGSYDNVSGVWTVGTVSSGVPQTLSITATVVSPAAQTNTGTISDADQFDPNTANNTASATETPQQADVMVVKQVSNPTPNVGDQITFTVTLNNVGPDAATGVQVTDLLPAGLNFVSATPSQGSYDNTSGVWTVGTVSSGVPQTLSITATVVSPAAQTNTGTITDADQFDPNAGNNTASATETPQQADVMVVKQVSNPTPNVGDQITFTVTLNNVGPDAATGVQVTDLLPAGLAFVSATPSQGTYNPGTGFWDVGTVSSGVPQTLSITATVVSPAAQTNTGTISDADQFDPNAGNNTASATETPQQTDLSVSKTVSNPTPNVGDQITFTVTLNNDGPDAATGVQVTDLLPAGLTFVSATPSQGTYNPGTGFWDIGTVSPGVPQTLSITATVVSPAAQTNTGTISDADQFDPNAGNNTASATETPQQTDLSVSKTVSNPTPNVGDQITFTVTLNNVGPDAATGVQVTDLLPAGLTFVSATPSQGTYNPGTGFWDIGTVSPGVPQTLSITATVVSPAAQTNTGTISDADQFDPNAGNNTASATETPQQADVMVVKQVSNPTPNVGDQITFTVTLNNVGPDAATGVQVTDLLPAGLTFVSATPSQGSYDNTSGVWTVGTVSSGVPQTLSITATVVSPAAQTNTGTISDADQFDPITANNTASATVTAPNTPGVAQNDAFTTAENAVLNGVSNVFADNGSGPDSDPDDPLQVTAVNGNALNVGTTITLASGALLTLNANGTFSYDPNGAFDALPTPASGASNTPGTDSFTYTITGSSTATVTVTITGVDSDDTLIGTAGIDNLSGGIGNDLYFVGNTGDGVNEAGGAGYDIVAATVDYVLPVNVEALYLIGAGLTGTGSGNADSLLSSGGPNTLVGLVGDDLYYVNNIGDAVTESGGAGYDTVVATVGYTLPTNVEAMYVIGAGLTGTGSGGADSLFSTGGPNTLVGLGGNDLYYVNNTGDTVTEAVNGGSDTMVATVNYTLPANVEAMYMIGSGLTGTGSANADSLFSNGGPNTLVGLGSDDLYYVNNTGDVVTEAANGGFDGVVASVSYTLSTNVEVLYMIGSGLTGTGTGSADTLVTLGANTVVGGDGNDAFVFVAGSASGATVADFNGHQANEADYLFFSGFGTEAQGASFSQIGSTDQWQIHSGLDAHNETITLANGAAPDTGDFFFV